MSLDLEADWLERKALVEGNMKYLLDLGIPIENARSIAGWNPTLDFDTFAEVSVFPPLGPADVPYNGLRKQLRILFSRSADRTNNGNLDGAQLDAGKLYAIWIPDIPELNIINIQFSLDGSVVHVEGSTPWDYDGTEFDGSASRVTFVAGEHEIQAYVTDPGPGGASIVTAAFNVE